MLQICPSTSQSCVFISLSECNDDLYAHNFVFQDFIEHIPKLASELLVVAVWMRATGRGVSLEAAAKRVCVKTAAWFGGAPREAGTTDTDAATLHRATQRRAQSVDCL